MDASDTDGGGNLEEEASSFIKAAEYPNYYLEKMFKLILKRIVISTHLPQLFDIT